jgi:probable F420-dependent oxidoreductase
MNTDEAVDPLELARAAEALGIESIFVPDHSHVPVNRKMPYGGPKGVFPDSPGDMPREYYRNRDQLLTLAAMAAVTTTLKIGTGICLVVQRDPILLAKEVATLDHISNGRLLFGVGAGAPWNEEEMRNHGTDPGTRFTLMRERIEAMKTIWANDQAEYHGRFVDFGPIFSWPKPVQRPHPPIIVGGWGPGVVDRVLAYGDGWLPGPAAGDLATLRERIRDLQERAAQMGRDPVEVTLNLARLDCVDQYVDMGISRCVFNLPTAPAAVVRAALKEISRVADRMKG